MTEDNRERDLQVSTWSVLRRLSVERVGERAQLWCFVEHKDGSRCAYFAFMDQGDVVVPAQLELLRDAFVHRHEVFFHYEDVGRARQFHAVTLVRGDG